MMEKTETKEYKQSPSKYRSELFPAHALLAVSNILKEGADKYGVDSWKDIPIEVHVGRAITHLLLYLSGDDSEYHLGNASCRVLFALDMEGP